MKASALTAVAGEAVAEAGTMLVGAASVRLGAIYRVTSGGSARLLVDGKRVTVPAATLSKNEVRKLRA